METSVEFNSIAEVPCWIFAVRYASHSTSPPKNLKKVSILRRAEKKKTSAKVNTALLKILKYDINVKHIGKYNPLKHFEISSS